jgi:rhamnosyltransferase
MRHGLGERPNYFMGRYVPVHPPLRHYYLMRNGIWLQRQAWIPITWKLATLRRLVLVLIYFLALQPHRRKRLFLMLHGLADGLRGRMGKYTP